MRSIINGYDADGNFAVLKRYGSSNNLVDNYTYQYFSGTNKLKTVTGQLTDDYAYDANGNLTKDAVNRNYDMQYDHRNLLTYIRSIKTEGVGSPGGPVDVTYVTLFKYDEAGNRVRKTNVKYLGQELEPVYEGGDNPVWQTMSDEFYVRDVSGKEIAIYSGTTLTQWNIWGLDNEGKINADTTRNYYLKDHLGSIRVVLNSTNQVISAQDYDAWGYLMENRSYNATAMKYDFTGKERDDQTNYDYFGARYYDSRIGRWGGVEPLLEKFIDASPYCYGVDNPIILKDLDGMDLKLGGDLAMALNDLKSMISDESIQSKITADDNGVVSFDVTGIDMSSDAAIELVYNMVSSSKSYLYEVADKTYEIRRNTIDENKIAGRPNYIDLTQGKGYANLSRTAHEIQNDGSELGAMPKIGYHGQVSLGKGNWKDFTNTRLMPRSNMVFHELAENYYRTEFEQQYHDAHPNANKLADNYKKQVGKPGEGGDYVYP